MFIFIKTTTSPHEDNSRAERIRNSGKLFLACLVETFGARCAWKKCAHCDTFSRYHELWKKQIVHLKWAFVNLQNMAINYLQKKYKLSIRSFLEYYCYKTVLMRITVFSVLKNFVHDTNLHKIFIKPFNYLITQLLSFFSEILFFLKRFLLNTPLLTFKTWWITDWLTQIAFMRS